MVNRVEIFVTEPNLLASAAPVVKRQISTQPTPTVYEDEYGIIGMYSPSLFLSFIFIIVGVILFFAQIFALVYGFYWVLNQKKFICQKCGKVVQSLSKPKICKICGGTFELMKK